MANDVKNSELNQLLDENELLIKDEQGNFRIFKNGQMLPLDEFKKRQIEKQQPAPQISTSVASGNSDITDNYQKAALDFIIQQKISFETEDKKQTFIKYLATYFKNLRSQKELHYLLTRPKESQGIGLTNDQANTLILAASRKKQELEKQGASGTVKLEVSTQTSPQVLSKKSEQKITKKIENNFKSKALQPKEKKSLGILKPTPILPMNVNTAAKDALKKQAIAEEFRFSAPKIASQSNSQMPSAQVKSETVKTPAVNSSVAKQDISSSGKTLVTDIKFPVEERRLVGPIDEISRINLVDFRRMGSRFKEIILEKIELLGEENFDNKIKGIVAWKRSAINKLYLIMSLESIIKAMSIDDLIIEWQRNDKPCLTRSEYEEIIKFNNILNF